MYGLRAVPFKNCAIAGLIAPSDTFASGAKGYDDASGLKVYRLGSIETPVEGNHRPICFRIVRVPKKARSPPIEE
jgi:hypothetical protein